MFRFYAEDSRSIFLAAVTGRLLAGYIIARADFWGVEIISIAVLPRARRSGVGDRLMRSIIGRAQRRGARAIRLMVKVDNARAIAFYRRYGFLPAGRIPEYYEDGADALKMRRTRV